MKLDEKQLEKYNREHKIIDGVDHKWCKYKSHWVKADLEHFYANKSNGIDGLSPNCKECDKEKANIYQQNNREKIRLEKALDYKINPDYYKAKDKKWRNKNKDRKSKTMADWLKNNKDKLHKYREKRKVKDHKITIEEWNSCKEYFNNSCAYCGLSVDNHYRKYAGALQKVDLHKEHVDDEGCGDLENCVPACQSCNSSKHTAKLDDWYNESNDNYVEERYDKIVKWTTEDYKQYIKPPKPKGKYTKDPNNPRWKNSFKQDVVINR